MLFLKNPPTFLFFTGKGGVGKTSLSCATAIRLVRLGKKVLLVSTDPASNVGQVFSQEIGNKITAISTVPGLFALEIDPQQAAGSEAEIEAAFTTAYQILRRRIEAFLALPWTRWEEGGDVALQAELARIGEQ